MKSQNVEGWLQQMERQHTKLMELLEWEALALRERDPQRPPGLDPAYSSLEDVRASIRDTHGYFLHLAIQVHRALKGDASSVSEQQRRYWKGRVRALEGDVARLRLCHSF